MTDAPVIGFAGLTHLGIVSAAAAAARGFRTIGFDPERAATLAAGALPIVEPGLEALLRDGGDRLSFSADPAALREADLVFLSPDVPTGDDGASDLAPVAAILDRILPELGPSASLCVLSQVPPGFTRQIAFDPARRFTLVETLIFGRAVERAMGPERFIVGLDDPARPLPPALQAYLGAFGCPILPMRHESAELAKISINLCLIAQVSTANMLADLASRLGADWSEIAPALRLDRRIGPAAYLKPGLGLAGGNLERDLASVCRIGDELGAETGVARAFLADSTYRRDGLIRTVADHLPGAARIGLLGLAYKEDTASTRNSAALGLIAALPEVAIAAYDPAVTLAAPPSPHFRRAETALAAIRDADILVVATPWAEFRALDAATLATAMRGRVIVDPYQVLDGTACIAAGFTYRTLGRSSC